MKIIIDLDQTITAPQPDENYDNASCNLPVVEKLRHYRDQGFVIVIHTARNMRTYDGNVGEINVHTLPNVIDWLKRNDVPFDEILVGKPWCGKGGFYVDDKAIRPDEFSNLSLAEIYALVGEEAPQ